MDFIFDTGASSVSISLNEARFLIKQKKLSDVDIIEETRFSDATGKISAGTKINLKEVQIGNKVLYNVEANVVHNLNAPLLLGQSVLSRFGKISFDYNELELTIE